MIALNYDSYYETHLFVIVTPSKYPKIRKTYGLEPLIYIDKLYVEKIELLVEGIFDIVIR
jgi:hypothetical protein